MSNKILTKAIKTNESFPPCLYDSDTFRSTIVQNLAQDLTNADSGDVVFIVHGSDSLDKETNSLYAWGHMLVANGSETFFSACRIIIATWLTQTGFAAPWNHQNASYDADGRRIIIVEDIDFVTMHNVLYFLYTGLVNLHNSINFKGKETIPKDEGYEWTAPAGYPDSVDAFSLYCAAYQFLIEDLKALAFRYLHATCRLDNICERLFDESCEPYEELREVYVKYVTDNFMHVTRSEQWKEISREANEPKWKCIFEEIDSINSTKEAKFKINEREGFVADFECLVQSFQYNPDLFRRMITITM